MNWFPRSKAFIGYKVGALTIGNFNSCSDQLAAMALRHSIAAIYQYRKSRPVA